jgi:CHAT domain-containing protein
VTGTTADVNAVRLQPPLPETAVEVCAVAASLQAGRSAVHLGGTAREAIVKNLSQRGRLARYRIVHFATHGIMAGEFDGNIEPALVMTPPAKSSQADDGLLSASEVAQLRLNADWVVLSACNTAAGDNLEAEAFSGLARAFFHAGARTLLVSHWYVNSLATVRLTTGAFQAMADAARQKRPLGGAEALRRATVSMMLDEKRPDYGHPALWAPFVVVGEGSAHR